MAAILSRLETEFVNVPPTDYSDPENRRKQQAAIDAVRAKLGQTYPLIIGGETIMRDVTFDLDQSRAAGSGGRVFRKGNCGDARGAIAAAEAPSPPGNIRRPKSERTICSTRRNDAAHGVWNSTPG